MFGDQFCWQQCNFDLTLGRKVGSYEKSEKKKIGKKSCSGLIKRGCWERVFSFFLRISLILSDLSDKITWLWIRPLHDFFPIFFFGLKMSTPSDRASYCENCHRNRQGTTSLQSFWVIESKVFVRRNEEYFLCDSA